MTKKESKAILARRKEMLNRAINEFDAAKMRAIMVLMDWKWNDVGVPTEKQIIKNIRGNAREMLKDVTVVGNSSGGIRVEIERDAGYDVSLHVTFEAVKAAVS